MPEEKDYVNVSKGVHKQKTYKSLCIVQELYTAFKEKHSNIGFSKFCALRCVLAGSKVTHSVCVCSAHQNVMLLVDAMDWDLIKLILSCLKYFN